MNMVEIKVGNYLCNEFLVTSVGILGPEIAIDVGKPTFRIIKRDSSNHSWEEQDAEINEGCPSKFLTRSLNLIHNDMQLADPSSIEDDTPFFVSSWGFEFWSCYKNGNDVLNMEGGSKIEKIAWITSTATDTISMMEEEGKPSLQDFGRFWYMYIAFALRRFRRLSNSKVIDGLEEGAVRDAYLDAVKRIWRFISGNNTRTVIFSDATKSSSSSAGGWSARDHC